MPNTNIKDRFITIALDRENDQESKQACHHIIMTPYTYTMSQKRMALRQLMLITDGVGAAHTPITEQDVVEYQENSATSYLTEE